VSNDEHLATVAKAYRAEAEQIKRAAEQDLEAARYERGQIEHAKRAMEQLEASIVKREQALKQAGEPEFVARLAAAADKALAEAKAIKADYDAIKHGAAQALVEINEREKRREQSPAA
jgi:hypothetical protein